MKTAIILLTLLLDPNSPRLITIRYNGIIKITELKDNDTSSQYELQFCSPEISKCHEDTNTVCEGTLKLMYKQLKHSHNEIKL